MLNSLIKSLKTSTIVFTTIWCALLMTLTTGCVSGGFKLTRQYSMFVNRQNIIIRILLYIITLPIFAITLLVDSVVNNTLDFWAGRVAQGTYQFKDQQKTFVAQHGLTNDGKTRESHIQIFGEKNELLQDIVIRELANSTIDVLIDGALKANVTDIKNIPQISLFDANGRMIESHAIPNTDQVAAY